MLFINGLEIIYFSQTCLYVKNGSAKNGVLIPSLALLSLSNKGNYFDNFYSFCQKKGKKGCQRTEKKEVKQQRDCV
jgi:hypothetical protein